MIIRKRNSHKGSITLGIASLSLLSLASIGFATWVISGGDTKTAEGTITVDTVNNNLHSITVGDWTTPASDNKNGKIYFGKDNTTLTSTSAWLSNDSTETAVLENSLTVTVANAYNDQGSLVNGATPTATLSITDTTANGKYTSAVTNKVVGALPAQNASTDTEDDKYGTIVVSSATKKETSAEFKITITFKWGSAFGGVNPAQYAENMASSSASYWDLSNKSSFASKLNEVYSLNNIAFTLTITTD